MKRMQKWFRLSKIGKKWAFSLVAGFLVLFVLLFIVQLRAISLIKKDKMRESGQAVLLLQKGMDRQLQNLQELAVTLMLNKWNLSLQTAEAKSDFIAAPAYEFSELLYNIKMANTLVEDIYFYYPNADYIVGTKGSYTSKQYFLLNHLALGERYAYWHEQILSADRIDFFFVGEQEELKLFFRQRMPVNSEKQTLSILIISIDGQEFAHLLDMNLPYETGGMTAVLSKDGQLYQADSEMGEQVLHEIQASGLTGNEFTSSFQSQDYVGWLAASQYQSFHYLVVSNVRSLLSPILKIQVLLLMGIILCTGIGLFISFYFSWKHYAPIENTVRCLKISRNTEQMDYCEFEKRIKELIPLYEQTLILSWEGKKSSFKSDSQNVSLLWEKWKKYLQLREYMAACQMLPEVFGDYIGMSEDTYIRLSRYYAVIHLILQSVELEDKKYKTGFLADCLANLKNNAAPKLLPYLQEILMELEIHKSLHTATDQEKPALKIKKIIEQSYFRPDLGLEYISEQINVSTSHISKVFKEEYGVGISEYINRLRIDKAKEYMCAGNVTVKELAEKVGYSSDIHFIRIFKQMEQITPGAFRKKMKETVVSNS